MRMIEVPYAARAGQSSGDGDVASRLILNPALGGAIMHFEQRGLPVLRPTPAGADDPLQTASFPLVPFANRIAGGRFDFDGREIRLAPNLGDHPHTLHGQGWRDAWTVAAVSPGRAVLTLAHAADEWPWSWTAEQVILHDERGLRTELSVRNTSDRPMPAGLGFHPAFPAPQRARLKASLDGVWLIDDQVLPVHRASMLEWAEVCGRNWTADAPVAGTTLVDHCFTGWDGRAEITAPGRPATILTASDNCGWLHIFSPPGGDFLCCEPVTHHPDPFAQPNLADTGVAVLAPGEILSAWMQISLADS
jgi:aldose 1-epimerase